jgi:hypothetical protein
VSDVLPETISYRPIRVSLVTGALLALAFAAVIVWATHLGWTNGRASVLGVALMAACALFFAYVSTGYLSQLGDRQNLTLDREGFSSDLHGDARKSPGATLRSLGSFSTAPSKALPSKCHGRPTPGPAESTAMRLACQNS